MVIPAIITAGDRGAAKAIYGESKVYLEIEGRPMVSHVVLALQDVEEISEVWVIGDAARLEAVLSEDALQQSLRKPLHIVEQHNNLYENAWEAFRRALPGAPPEGRDPADDRDRDFEVLYLSGDLPFATAGEISDFIRRGQALECDYALGLVREQALVPYMTGEHSLDIAFFNLRDDRLRQNNLHLAKPARIGRRQRIEDMYRYRHMREFRDMAGLAWVLLFKQGGLVILFFYFMMHLGGMADRKGLRWFADWVRNLVSLDVNAKYISKLLDTDFRFVVTDLGGCAIDVDTEAEYDAVRLRFEEWFEAQKRQVENRLAPGEPSKPPADSD